MKLPSLIHPSYYYRSLIVQTGSVEVTERSLRIIKKTSGDWYGQWLERAYRLYFPISLQWQGRILKGSGEPIS